MTQINIENLPVVSSGQSRLFELTAGAGRHLPVRFGNDLWNLVCVAAPQNWKAEIAIPLAIGGDPALLELCFTPGSTLFDRHAEFRQISSMSEPFSLAIRATLSRELLDALQNALDAGVEIAPVIPQPLPALVMAFDILNQEGSLEGRGVLRLGDETLNRIESVCPSWQSSKNPRLANLKHSVALCAAVLEVSVGDLAALSPGDCLLLGDASAWPYPVWISSGAAPAPAGVFWAAPEPPLLQISIPSEMKTSDSPSAPLSDLQLPVLVVAGRREMTLQDLAGLREGASIEVGNGGDIPVEIEVNRQVIAKGRLVRVADKICANITEVLLPAKA
jgi:flagellar motor switch/type III secretory pathway protein FliN